MTFILFSKTNTEQLSERGSFGGEAAARFKLRPVSRGACRAERRHAAEGVKRTRPRTMKILGHCRQDGRTEDARRGSAGGWDVEEEKEQTERRRRTRRRGNGDEGADDNWASFASVSVSFTHSLLRCGSRSRRL